MKYYIILFIALLSLSFSEDAKSKQTSLTPASALDANADVITKNWKEEEKKIENAELKAALERLRKEFSNAKEIIVEDYNSKIKNIQKQKHVTIDNLKKDFIAKRDALRKKYGSKPKKKRLKKRKKDISNVDEKKKPIRASSIDKKDNKPSKIVKKKTSDNSSTEDEKIKPAKK